MDCQDTHPVTTYETILGQVLRREREARGLNQGQLARRAGVTQPYWSRIEQGTAQAGVGILRRASEELGLTYGQVVSLADRACEEARHRGVEVISLEETKSADWLPLLGAAVVGALIGYVIAKSGSK